MQQDRPSFSLAGALFGVPKLEFFDQSGTGVWSGVAGTANQLINSSMVGAVYGAAYAGMTGGNVSKGALMGALGWAAGTAFNMLIGHAVGFALSETGEIKDGTIFYYAKGQVPFTVGGVVIGDKRTLAEKVLIGGEPDPKYTNIQHEQAHFPQQTALSVTYIPLQLLSQGLSWLFSGFTNTHRYNIFERWWIDVPSY